MFLFTFSIVALTFLFQRQNLYYALAIIWSKIVLTIKIWCRGYDDHIDKYRLITKSTSIINDIHMVNNIFFKMMRNRKGHYVVRPIVEKKKQAQQFFSFLRYMADRITLNCDSPIMKTLLLFLMPHEVYFMRKGDILCRDTFMMYISLYNEWKMDWVENLPSGTLVDSIARKNVYLHYGWEEARVYSKDTIHFRDKDFDNVYLHGIPNLMRQCSRDALKPPTYDHVFPLHTKTIPWRQNIKVGSPIEVCISEKYEVPKWHKAIVVNIERPKEICKGRWVNKDKHHRLAYYQEFCAACFTKQKEWGSGLCERCLYKSIKRYNRRVCTKMAVTNVSIDLEKFPPVEMQEAGNLQLRLIRCSRKKCVCRKRLSMVWDEEKTRKVRIHFVPTIYKGEMGYRNKRGYIALSSDALRRCKI